MILEHVSERHSTPRPQYLRVYVVPAPPRDWGDKKGELIPPRAPHLGSRFVGEGRTEPPQPRWIDTALAPRQPMPPGQTAWGECRWLEAVALAPGNLCILVSFTVGRGRVAFGFGALRPTLRGASAPPRVRSHAPGSRIFLQQRSHVDPHITIGALFVSRIAFVEADQGLDRAVRRPGSPGAHCSCGPPSAPHLYGRNNNSAMDRERRITSRSTLISYLVEDDVDHLLHVPHPRRPASRVRNSATAGMIVGLTLTVVHLIGIPHHRDVGGPARISRPALVVGQRHLRHSCSSWRRSSSGYWPRPPPTSCPALPPGRPGPRRRRHGDDDLV